MINVTLLKLNQMCTELINRYHINEKYCFSNLTITYFSVCKYQSRKVGLMYAILIFMDKLFVKNQDPFFLYLQSTKSLFQNLITCISISINSHHIHGKKRYL